MTDDEFDVAFRKVDTNGSGKIEFDEFFAWYTEQTEADKRMVRALKVEAELRRRLGTGELEPEEKRAVRSRLAMVELRRSAPSPSARPCCPLPRRSLRQSGDCVQAGGEPRAGAGAGEEGQGAVGGSGRDGRGRPAEAGAAERRPDGGLDRGVAAGADKEARRARG